MPRREFLIFLRGLNYENEIWRDGMKEVGGIELEIVGRKTRNIGRNRATNLAW